jgi:hypothetical protein
MQDNILALYSLEIDSSVVKSVIAAEGSTLFLT